MVLEKLFGRGAQQEDASPEPEQVGVGSGPLTGEEEAGEGEKVLLAIVEDPQGRRGVRVIEGESPVLLMLGGLTWLEMERVNAALRHAAASKGNRGKGGKPRHQRR